MTACTEIAPLLVARGLDLLEGEQPRAVEQHLAGCPACREREARLVPAVLEGLRAPALPADPGAWDALAARIEADRRRRQELKVALSCAYCHDALPKADAAFCGACLAAHHEECFRTHGRCSAPGCDETRLVRAAGVAAPAPARRRRRFVPLLGGALVVAAAAAWGGHAFARRPMLSVRQEGSGYGAQVFIVATGAEVRDVIRELAVRSGKNIIIHPDVRGTIDVELAHVSWLRALHELVQTAGEFEVVEEREDLLRIVPRSSIQQQVESAMVRVRRLRGADARALATLVEQAVKARQFGDPPDPQAAVEFDPAANVFLVTGTRPTLNAVHALVEKYDLPPETPAPR